MSEQKATVSNWLRQINIVKNEPGWSARNFSLALLALAQMEKRNEQ